MRKMYRIKADHIKSGVISGLLGAWAIFGAILLVDSTLGLEVGTFYRVAAIAFGFIEYALYIGFLLHMLMGISIGILFSIVMSLKLERVEAYKSILFGISTGIIAWSIVFMPLTLLLINPSLDRVSSMINEPRLINIAESELFIVGTILMHLMYGFILGLMYYLGVAEVRVKEEKEV